MFHTGSHKGRRRDQLRRWYYQGGTHHFQGIALTDREIMMHRMRVSLLMDVGNISMPAGDNDSSSLSRLGGILRLRNVRVGYWICSSSLSFLMLVQGRFGNSRQNRTRSMVEVKVLQLQVWTCLKRGCLAVTSRIPTELTVRPYFVNCD